MTIKKILIVFSLLCGAVLYTYAQQYPGAEFDAERRRQQEEERLKQEQRDLRQRSIDLDNLQKIRRAESNVPLEKGLSEKDKALRKKMVAPHAEDLILVQEFLKQPGTGIFRLFPDYDCLENSVVKVGGKCENIFPGTWFYSFRQRDYSDDVLFDLQLKNGRLVTDGFLSQGILTKLGNFSLNDVNLESKAVKFINDFKPAEKSTEVKTQYEQLSQGIESGGYRYSKEVDAKLGEVYLLRVIAYQPQRKFKNKISKLDSFNAIKLLLLEHDKREDITIAFRVIRKDVNGNLTIISKELAKKKSPEIIFAEK